MTDIIAINEAIRSEEQTPIEIAMQIDENGMTTASALYEWLDLDPSHYARWCKSNILDNSFAIEGEDYIVAKPSNGAFATDGERENTSNPKPKTDYHITANLAKKLAMLTKSKRGEAARKYFLKIESEFKLTVKQYNDLLNNYNEMKNQLNELSVKFGANIDKLDCRIACIESGTSVSGGRLSPWVKEMSSKVMELANYYENTVKKMYSVIIARMENKFGIFFQSYFNEYVNNHPNESPVWRIVVIEYYDLIDLFESAYKDLAKEIGLYSDDKPDNYYDF